MNGKTNRATLFVMLACVPFMLACLYLDRMIQAPEPKMEASADKMLEVLKGTNWVPLQALASESYSEAEFAKPGTLTFTTKVTNDKPVYFSYGWCARDEKILKQNFEHIAVHLYLNAGELGSDVVHNISYTKSDGQVCLEYGMLLSDWPAGEFQLKAVATFDEKLNDGFSDYEPGDYVYAYNVKVDK